MRSYQVCWMTLCHTYRSNWIKISLKGTDTSPTFISVNWDFALKLLTIISVTDSIKTNGESSTQVTSWNFREKNKLRSDCQYSFVPNCRGMGVQIANFEKKTSSSFNSIWHKEGGVFPAPSFVEQQWCSNVGSSFTNCSRVHKVIQNYESTQVSRLKTS